MTVCVSWMSFWLDHKSAPARVMLTITTLLAMSTTTASINNSLPPVAYTKVNYIYAILWSESIAIRRNLFLYFWMNKNKTIVNIKKHIQKSMVMV